MKCGHMFANHGIQWFLCTYILLFVMESWQVEAIVVMKSGSGDFTTVQEAVDSVPVNNSNRVIIEIFSGTYEERVVIPGTKPFITFVGEGIEQPVIAWNGTSNSTGSTKESYTVLVEADHFIAINVSFENFAPVPEPGAVGAQAVALRISGDMAAFYSCKFLGGQDTLYDEKGRHYFHDCYIRGNIDFICGNGQSLYKECEMFSVATTFGAIAAQYRKNVSDTAGFSFVNCKIGGSGSNLLGRAWGAASRVVYSSSYMADIIVPAAWGDWNTTALDPSLYYGEFNNSGPGANRTGRANFSKALTADEVGPFLDVSFIDGADWLD